MPEAAATDASGSEQRFLSFRSGGALYALPADEVLEVIRAPGLTRVPQSTKALLGLANLRGTVLPVASMRALLRQGGQDEGAQTRVLVLSGATPVGVMVDEVAALASIPVERIEAELDAGEGAFVTGAFQDEDSNAVIRVLDIRRMLAAEFPPTRRQAATGSRPASLKWREGDDRADNGRAIVLMSFELAGQEFALPLDRVQEVVGIPSGMAAVPHSDGTVLGAATLRDRLLPLVSGRAMLGLPPSAAGGEATQVVVVALAGAVIGLVVDRTRAILRVDPDRVDPLPAIMQRGSGEAEILAICRLDSGRRLVSILSADQLFREETMRRIKAEHTERGSPSGAESAGGVEEQFVVFQLAGEEYGLPIAAVDEVARVPAEMTRVPKAPAFVEGVMNLRGQVVPLIDQRRRFDLPERARDEGQRVIVINMDGARTGFIVDGVSQILKAPAESIGPAPDMSDEQTRLFSRVINLEADGRMILLLDPRELLDRTERRLLSALDDGELRSATP